MKKQNILLCLIAAIVFQLGCSTQREAKNQVTREEVVQAINGDNWRFSANLATSQYGNTRYLTSEYDVKLVNRSLDVHLPYFGRAYTASTSSQGPLQFKSGKFSYSKVGDRPGSWLITIKPEDFGEVQSMVFTFFESGHAQLNVTLTNRSPINFTGFVGAIK